MRLINAIAAGLAACCMLFSGATFAADSPNFLVIVADDLGWSDLGTFGSEIETPHLDALAQGGLTLTHFRVAPTCSPTRAMLLTGVDNHRAGLGTMDLLQTPNQIGSVNYGGQLHDGVVTLAEALSDAGYLTMMAGKWHLAVTPDQYPHQRGFQRSFSLLQGGASHFADRSPLHQGYRADYLEDGEQVELPADFYSSITYTDKMLQYLDEADEGRPIFAYLAYTAPHDPLQVPDEWLHKYAGVYDSGPEAVRTARIERQRELGLMPADVVAWDPPRYPTWLPMGRKPWLSRTDEQRKTDVRAMEIYAGMVEILDQQIGRVMEHLEASGRLDNTYIIFLSDNGANAATPLVYPGTERSWFLAERNHRVDAMGKPGSHVFQDREWATVSNTPFRQHKVFVTEGGIRVPFIVSGPDVLKGQRSPATAHATDLTPTLLELAGVSIGDNTLYEGKIVPQGKSMREIWRGEQSFTGRSLSMELFGNRTVVRDGWKALNINPPLGSGRWELFDLENDPAETTDLAHQYPEKLRLLIDEYQRYARVNGVIPPEPVLMRSSGVLYAGPCNWWCELQIDVLDLLLRAMANFRSQAE